MYRWIALGTVFRLINKSDIHFLRDVPLERPTFKKNANLYLKKPLIKSFSTNYNHALWKMQGGNGLFLWPRWPR